ncbi:MAG: polysulfide reductase NrfD [Armatimonadetes bacterium]|nr:polysulfide reductase NrfD [Armatimonadota bacterium]
MEEHTLAQADDAPVLRPLQVTGWGFRLFVAALLAVIAVGAYAYFTQLRDGLGVTGLNNRVSWGLYITNFVFFIGVSHAGTLISAILRVTGAEWRRPITRMAEAITAFALMVGAPMVLIDMGRPERLLSVFTDGRLQSPILWDVISITTYLTGSLLYLYLPMIPDLAMLRDRLTTVAPWKRWLYRVLSAGWRGTERQHAWLERAIAAMAIVIIPVAVSVHTVVSWIFGMTLRAGWHSTIFGPYFVVGAIFSGIAAIITAMVIFRRIYRLEGFLTVSHFRRLGYLLLTLNLVYLYFTVSEYLTISYGAQEHDINLVHALFYGPFAPAFWVMVVAGLVLPAVLLLLPHISTVDVLARVPGLRPLPIGVAAAALGAVAVVLRFPRVVPVQAGLSQISPDMVLLAAGVVGVLAFIALMPALRQRPVAAVFLASVLVNIGMWLKRYIIVIPSMALPITPSEWATYTPTWVEWAITAAAFAAFILLYALFSKVFPLISLWEVREGEAAPAPEPASAWRGPAALGGIGRPLVILLAAGALAAGAARASAASAPVAPGEQAKMPTRLTVSAPTSVEMGEDLMVEARLTTADGQPLAGAAVILFQVGAVGERVMARAATDEKGMASFRHNEYTIPHITLRVTFAGDARHAPARGGAEVEITGVKVPPSVSMRHTPGPLTRAAIFLVLGGVWLTYAYAGSFILRIARSERVGKGGASAHQNLRRKRPTERHDQEGEA